MRQQQQQQLFILALFLGVFIFVPFSAYGHGDPSETFPPVDLDGRLVTLEISSITLAFDNDDENRIQQISISMVDFNSKITLRDVTFLIKSERGSTFLFEEEFQANSGTVVFNYLSEDTDSIVVQEAESGLFGYFLGFEEYLFHVKGPNLANGGLYKFEITVITADGYSKVLDEPLMFNGGVSIAQTTTHAIADPNFGDQNINVITYYDEISDFEYDWESASIRFSMPFEWSAENIEQTSVVHEEIVFPNTFGDLLVSKFVMYVNGIKLPENVIQIDDFSPDMRTVHFIIPQKILYDILEDNQTPDQMNFVILPNSIDSYISSVTDNGQFRVLVQSDPQNLISGSNAKILFDITDIFLKNKSVAAIYELSVTHNGKIIFEQSGTSSDSQKENTAEFVIPKDVSGIIHLTFENLADNNFAKTTIPIVVDRIVPSYQDVVQIPTWIKSTAFLWSQGDIDDATFIGAIEYLVQNGIIDVSSYTTSQDNDMPNIPGWFRINASLWADGQINDDAFVTGLEFLIQIGIIRV